MSQRFYPAEWVLPGHPDKLCDAIADSLVEEAARRESRALCGVEVAVHRSSVFVTGRIACEGANEIDVEAVTRDVFRSAGYGGGWAPDPEHLDIRSRLCLGALNDGEAEFRGVSDDQSIVTGYAADEPALNYLPPEPWMASRIGAALSVLRRSNPDLRLGPDGKLIVVYDRDERRLSAFSASVQQAIGGSEIDLYREIRRAVSGVLEQLACTAKGFRCELPDEFVVNGAGNFAVGGPEGDNGLSGKKLVVDAYGPRAPIGGGALSGKDFFKADRAGALAARRLAKAVVISGAARECIATLAIFPGDRDFRVFSLADESGRQLDRRRWTRLFDLSLECAGKAYSRTAGLAEIARSGHFTSGERAWEVIRL